MPKPWSLHKAEISRLYIQEGKTLNEVRETLSRSHGFKASVRAYRMRINEWALQKYKPRDDAPDGEGDTKMQNSTNTDLERANSSEELSNYGIIKTDQVLKFGSSLSIPAKPSQASEVLALVQDPSAAPYALEILLIKWQPGGDYFRVLQGLLRTHQYCQFIPRSTKNGRPQLFEYVEEYVAQEDQLKVGKLLLEALYSARQTQKPTDPAWIVAWDAACRCNDWDAVRTILYDGSTASSIAGPIFLKSAYVVLAEQLLRRYIKQFRVLKARNSWVDKSERAEAESCRQNSMAILEEFCDTKTPLRTSLYKYSLEIIVPGESEDDSQLSQRCRDLVHYCRHKYLSMTNDSLDTKDILNGTDEDLSDTERDWLNTPMCHTPRNKQDTSVSPELVNKDPASSAGSDPGTTQSTSSWSSVASQPQDVSPPTDGDTGARTTVKTLMSKWKSLRGFNSCVHSILEGDESDVFIFDPSADGGENLFEAIRHHVPEQEQMSLTKAVLVACSTINLGWQPPTLTWWLSLFTTSDWNDFQIRSDSFQVQTHLGHAMPKEAMDLVLDATVSLVGERLLSDLKDAMVAIRADPSYTNRARDLRRDQDTFKQYMAIIAEFRRRNLLVDQSWLSYALNTM